MFKITIFREKPPQLDIDISLENIGVCVVFGKSGAGKTSFINAIAGLLAIDRGEIIFNNKTLFSSSKKINLAVAKRDVGYVFQEPRLFNHYSVLGNLNYGVKTKDKAHFQQVVELLGIEKLLNKRPQDLSGGERSRVAIGRTLLSKPKFLLMDEPLSNLDWERKNELLSYLRKMVRKLKIPVFYISHSIDEVLYLADNLLVIDQGKIKHFGKLEQIWHKLDFNQNELKPSSLWQLEVLELKGNNLKLNANGQLLSLNSIANNLSFNATIARVLIYAQDVSITLSRALDSSISNILNAKITNIKNVQHKVVVTLDLNGLKLLSEITLESLFRLKLKVGMDVFAQIKAVSIKA